MNLNEPTQIRAEVFAEWLIDNAAYKVGDIEGFEKLVKSVLIGMEPGYRRLAESWSAGAAISEREGTLFDTPYQEYDYRGLQEEGDGYGNGGDSQYMLIESGDGVGCGGGYGSNDGDGFGDGYGYNIAKLSGDGAGAGDF